MFIATFIASEAVYDHEKGTTVPRFVLTMAGIDLTEEEINRVELPRDQTPAYSENETLEIVVGTGETPKMAIASAIESGAYEAILHTLVQANRELQDDFFSPRKEPQPAKVEFPEPDEEKEAPLLNIQQMSRDRIEWTSEMAEALKALLVGSELPYRKAGGLTGLSSGHISDLANYRARLVSALTLEALRILTKKPFIKDPKRLGSILCQLLKDR